MKKNLISGIRKFLFDKEKRIYFLAQNHLYDKMDDESFLKMIYKKIFEKELDLENPVTYSEKIQWLKLYDRNPLYINMVDKANVKKIVEKKIGNKYIIPTLGIWNNPEEIDFDMLPSQFVLKCTHDSGGVVICKNKKELDIEKTKRKLAKCLNNDYYMQNREWPYKMVERKIIAEQYMEDKETKELMDYKFFCFWGIPKFMFIATDRMNPKEETKFDFYDMEFNHLPFENGHPNSKKEIKKPKQFDKMIEISKKLSNGFPHVRIDLYEINGEIYFGEYTLYHWSGLKKYVPDKWDYIFGKEIELPKKDCRDKI